MGRVRKRFLIIKQKKSSPKVRIDQRLPEHVASFLLREETLLMSKSCLRNLVKQAPSYQFIDQRTVSSDYEQRRLDRLLC